MTTGPCRRCGEDRPLHARGLCSSGCYVTCRLNGTLHLYERRAWVASELVDEYRHLALHAGLSRLEASVRLGVTKSRLEKAIERTAKRELDTAS